MSKSIAPSGPALAGNIILVGLMGAGKTSVGKTLARRLHKTFIDTDHEIERSTGVKIPLIFDIEGESGFRTRETRMLAELARRSNMVLATGGGIVLSADNRRLLRSSGTVIYLRASANDLWARARYDRNRPLLHTPDPLATLTELYTHRDPLYREVADLIVDTGNQSVGNLASALEKRLLLRESEPGISGGTVDAH